MITPHLTSLVSSAQAHPAAGFAAAGTPAYHPRYGPLIPVLLGLIVIGLALIAYLIWRGQQRRGTKPDSRHKEP